ncbi:MAG: malate dehydrogenase (quinone) [Saprospiraceae bacterium]|nr:malate dehydrogenase (quinone) [Saprospiraceae bacterium]
MKISKEAYYSDVILIGTGIMSATLGTFLRKLEPNWTMRIFERMDRVAIESSEAWNNAGTGHAAFCELNYTPEKPDGSISISKAVKIAESFEVSKEFWASLVEQNIIQNPENIIQHIPHISFVWGEEDVNFLRKRYEALSKHHLFSAMQYSETPSVLAEWMPLILEGRDPSETIAGTHMALGTDVNFGTLSRSMFQYLEHSDEVELRLHHEVEDIKRRFDGLWELSIKDLDSGDMHYFTTRFVFIGAGGGSLPLLEKADIPEGHGYGGFPISGQWLVCNKPDIIARHHAKVYGKAKVGSPPMSVPHLDTRLIEGQQALLFGPFAGFSTKFLKHGSYLDLPFSVKWGNIMPLVFAGVHNMPLTKYLVKQVVQSHEDRMAALKEYFPNAKSEDWTLQQAGQRVQVIKKDETEGGVLEFGTEVVYAKDGTLATLLGASPGASTSVSIMIDVLSKCFPDEMATTQWQKKMLKLIPSFGQSLAKDAVLCEKTRKRTERVLFKTNK